MAGWWSRWRFAARLARREVRRRPGRTLLVMMLVAAPVLTMTAGDVIYRTQDDSRSEIFDRRFGRADLAFVQAGDRVRGDGLTLDRRTDTLDRTLDELPGSSRRLEFHSIPNAPVRSIDRAATVAFLDLPLADPMTHGMVDVSKGRVPTRADEAMLSPGVADRFGVGIGGDLVLTRPDRTYRVVGLGRLSDDLRGNLMVVGSYPFDELDRENYVRTVLVERSAGAGTALPAALRSPAAREAAPFDLYTPTFDPYDPDGSDQGGTAVPAVAWGWVAGVIGLTAVGIIIAAAFATSARRQMVTLGQLSSNGADRALLRRTLALQGAWSGLAGSLTGSAVALLVLGPARDPLEGPIGQTLGPWVFRPFELGVIVVTGTVAATIAAYLPARGISKVPVLSALSGRRPLTRVPRWLVPTGLASFSMGTLLLLLVALASGGGGGGELLAAVAVLGGLGVLAGACCVSPALVAVLGPIGERTSGTTKLAARGLARTRARTAAVVTAVAVSGAVAMVAGTAVASSRPSGPADDAYRLADDLVVVNVQRQGAPATFSPDQGSVDEPAPRLAPVPESIRRQLSDVVGGADLIPLRYGTYDPAPPPSWGDTGPSVPNPMLVADEQVIDLLGLTDRDRRQLEAVGALVELPGAGDASAAPAPFTLPIQTQQGLVELRVAPAQDGFDNPQLAFGFVITEAAARRARLNIGESGLVGVAPGPLTGEQQSRLQELSADAIQNDPFAPVGTAPVADGDYIDIQWTRSGFQVSRNVLEGLAVAAALVLTLVVVAIGLALAAAEGRDERDVLVAVGAKPSAMRRFAGAKAWWMTALGGVLAVPVGFVPFSVVFTAQSSHNPLRFPWVVAASLVLATPLVAAVMAWAGSSIAQRLRPVQMSTFATD